MNRALILFMPLILLIIYELLQAVLSRKELKRRRRFKLV